MLIQFSVKNYKSFKEKQVFSMEAGTGDENIENIVTINETNERKEVKMCKHCGKPFSSENLKSEYCSPQCRNQANVYKSRAKNKE